MMYMDALYGFGEMVWREKDNVKWKAPIPGQEGYTDEERLRYLASLFFAMSDLLTAVDPEDARLELMCHKISYIRDMVACEFRDIGITDKIRKHWLEKFYGYDPREELTRILHRLQQGDTESELG